VQRKVGRVSFPYSKRQHEKKRRREFSRQNVPEKKKKTRPERILGGKRASVHSSDRGLQYGPEEQSGRNWGGGLIGETCGKKRKAVSSAIQLHPSNDPLLGEPQYQTLGAASVGETEGEESEKKPKRKECLSQQKGIFFEIPLEVFDRNVARAVPQGAGQSHERRNMDGGAYERREKRGSGK